MNAESRGNKLLSKMDFPMSSGFMLEFRVIKVGKLESLKGRPDVGFRESF